jgi:hypothetical protein
MSFEMGATSSIINTEVDIIIDGITPCLFHRETGVLVATSTIRIHPTREMFEGWRFDWSIPERQGYEVYALTVPEVSEVQGLIALRSDAKNLAVEGYLLEANPENVGNCGIYKGIGAHLTAFACKIALDRGFSAYYFIAKTNLIEHYKNVLGARQVGSSQKMIIEGAAFRKLLEQYYLGERR